MKQLSSWLLVVLFFSACQKEVKNSNQSEDGDQLNAAGAASGGTILQTNDPSQPQWGNFSITAETTKTELDCSGEVTISGALNNNIGTPGNKAISIICSDPSILPFVVQNATTISKTYSLSYTPDYALDPLALGYKDFVFTVTFDVNDRNGNNKTVSNTVSVRVYACTPPPGGGDPDPCTSALLSVKKSVIEYNADLNPCNYQVVYVVNNCASGITTYKLQGGLTSFTKLNEALTGWTTDPAFTGGQIGGIAEYTVKKTGNSNSVLTWTDAKTQLTAGVENYFVVTFGKPYNWQPIANLENAGAYSLPAGTTLFDYLTGQWSIKANSILLAPYTPRVIVTKGE